MAAKTTAKAGNWSDNTVWTGGTKPATGDTVTLNHAVTLDQNADLGTSTAAQVCLAINAALVINDGCRLTIRGLVTQANNVVTTGNGAGSIVFDSTAAADPVNTRWNWTIGSGWTSSPVHRLTIRGTSAKRFLIMSTASGCNGAFTCVNDCGGSIDAEYCDFIRIGDAATPFMQPRVGAFARFAYCNIYQCGTSSAVNAGANYTLDHSNWIESVATGSVLTVSYGTNTASNCDFGSRMDFASLSWWTLTNNIYRIGGANAAQTAAPYPARKLALTVPALIGVGSPATVTAALGDGTTAASDITVTFSDGGKGGSFAPATVTLNTANPSGTTQYTPVVQGIATISATSGGAILDLFATGSINVGASAVTTYTLTGPASVPAATDSTAFTLTLGSGLVAAPIVFTPSDGAKGGSFTPATVTLTDSVRSGTFTYHPRKVQNVTVSTTNSSTLPDPAGVAVAVVATGAPTADALLWTGPRTLESGRAGTYTVTPRHSGNEGILTDIAVLTDHGAGGVFSTNRLIWTADSATQTFTYTPAIAATGPVMISLVSSVTSQTLGVQVFHPYGLCQTLKAGNWSDPTVWAFGRVPQPGDVVLIRHATVLDVNTDIGDSEPGRPALYLNPYPGGTANLGLTINDGCRLTLRGNVVQANFTIVQGNGAGSIVWDATQAANPATTRWTWQISTGWAMTATKITIRGTSSKRFLVASVGLLGSGSFVPGNDGGGGIDAEYCDFVGIGTATILMAQPRGIGQVRLVSCNVDQCGQLWPFEGNATFALDHTVFSRPAATYSLAANYNYTSTVTNCDFGGRFDMPATGWTTSGNTYRVAGTNTPLTTGPYAAAVLTLSGPASGASGSASTAFTAALAAGTTAAGVVVTPASTTGTFAPSTVTLTTAAPSATFTYTPATAGAKTISLSSASGLLNPPPLVYQSLGAATAYTLSGPVFGGAGLASGAFTVTPNGLWTGTITPADGAGGTFSPASVSWTAEAIAKTFVYTPGSTGLKTISATNSGALANPLSWMFASQGAATAYELLMPTKTDLAKPMPVVVRPNGVLTGTITPADGGSGTFSTPSLAWANEAGPKVLTYTQPLYGTRTIATTNSGTLPNPAGVACLFDVQLGIPTAMLSNWGDGCAHPPVSFSQDLGDFNFFNGVFAEYHRDISTDPVDPRSAQILTNYQPGGAYASHNLYFLAGPEEMGSDMQINIVDDETPDLPIVFNDLVSNALSYLPAESDPGPMPIPPNASVEGVVGYSIPGDGLHDPVTGRSPADTHCLVYHRGRQKLYELYSAFYNATAKQWHAISAAIFDIAHGGGGYTVGATTSTSPVLPNVGSLRKSGWTSCDAAGLPILPFLTRYDEAVTRGVIRHPIRLTFDGANCTTGQYVHPARHQALYGWHSTGIPYGARLRLTQAWYDANKNAFTGVARVFVEAMRHYGVINCDGGIDWDATLVADSRWDPASIQTLRTIPASAFEIPVMAPGFTVALSAQMVQVGKPVTVTVQRNPVTDTNYWMSFGITDGADLTVRPFNWPAVAGVANQTMSGDNPTLTFTYTPTTTGVKQINGRCGDEWVPPAPVALTVTADSPATTYTLNGPNSGQVGQAASITITPNGAFLGSITLSDSGAGGTFSPVTVRFPGDTTPRTVTYTPASAGTSTITASNNGGLINPVGTAFVALPNIVMGRPRYVPPVPRNRRRTIR